ncbi:MAG: glycoside hydrolase family 3 N-terminal domain-containing protein [Flavobacteriales bacterium]
MKLRNLSLALFCAVGTTLSAQQSVEAKIDQLISSMTLQEKVGQMTQLTLDMVCKGQPLTDGKTMEIDQVKLDSVLLHYHVGSILNTGTSALPREKWFELITQIQKVATEKTRLKIPVLYGIDAIHGATYTQGSTMFPQELGMAATWNPSLAEKGGSVCAYEVRASAIPWNFSPVLDLGRQPLWSRFFETYGEDPYLATQMGNAIVKGYQGDNFNHPEKVAACLKHYVGYSYSVSGKDRTPILMPERLLREYYLVPFANAIKNGAMTVMVNSSEINGSPVHADYHILTEILKQELKFEGFAVTDWEDIIMLHTVHKVAPTYKDAVAMAINAGIDMSMTPLDVSFCKYLIELVNEGKVPMSRIDDAVRRILRVKFKLGLFEHPYYGMKNYSKFGSAEFADASYQAALESITLLKNQNTTLPLSKEKKVLVTGVAANLMNPLNGAWTHTWQGVETKFNTPGKKTVYQAIQDEIGAAKAVYVEGTSYDKDVNTAAAVKEAANVDYIIVCLGEKPSAEKPGDIDDLTMDKVQMNLVKELAKTGKPIILVLAENRPRIISEIEPLVAAVVMAYHPGNEGGRAIAEILFGDANPSGKLPFTYPRYTGSFSTYDYKFSETRDQTFGFNEINPQYTFGSGLSYTSFQYSDLTIDKTKIGMSDSVKVSVKVTNTGKREGKEVVQLYVRDEYASITPSNKRLRGFSKVSLKAGESTVVTFVIHPKDLAFVNAKNEWITEAGDFTVMIDKMSKGFLLTK